MKTTVKQPNINLAEVHAKVLKLTEMAQTKKEELHQKLEILHKKQKEEKVAKEKAERNKYLKDLFADGGKFAKWGRLFASVASDSNPYLIEIFGFRQDCRNIGEYIHFLETIFGKLQDQFKEREKHINDPKRKLKTVSNPSRCRAFPGSGTVINDCCGGVNGHRRDCGYSNLQEISLNAAELEVLKKKQGEESEALAKEIAISIKAIHAHMEGFIEAMLAEAGSDSECILYAVKVAMITGVDTFHEFGARPKVLRHLQTTFVDKIEAELSTEADIDKERIGEIERILHEIEGAVRQQINL